MTFQFFSMVLFEKYIDKEISSADNKQHLVKLNI